MKAVKWENQDHPRERWLAKLGEEFGEVSREVVEEIRDDATPGKRRKARERLYEELGHLVFIAECWMDQLERAKS